MDDGSQFSKKKRRTKDKVHISPMLIHYDFDNAIQCKILKDELKQLETKRNEEKQQSDSIISQLQAKVESLQEELKKRDVKVQKMVENLRKQALEKRDRRTPDSARR